MMASSARYTVEQTLRLILGGGLDEFDSGDEEDILEDPEFPLPSEESDQDSTCSSSGEGSSEGMHEFGRGGGGGGGGGQDM